MRREMLPQATVYDRTEDLLGSVDPLGTVPGAEQLADVLFPGMTARMWRARHLTFAALAALVAERAMPDDESKRLDARLAFERLFVAAIARQGRGDNGWKQAARRLPGIGLARRAGNQPLGGASFLKGQAINGAFGVVSRLARDLKLIDSENDELESNGRSLLAAWARDQNLPGLLDDDNSDSAGTKWLKKLTKQVHDLVEKKAWPNLDWDDVASRVRSDGIRQFERNQLLQQLSNESSPHRRRMLDLLKDTVAVYDTTKARGTIERQILFDGVLKLVKKSDSDIDQVIALTIRLADAYERVSGLLEAVFRGIVWRLSVLRCQRTRAEITADRKLAESWGTISKELAKSAEQLQQELNQVDRSPQLFDGIPAFEGTNRERIAQLVNDARMASHDENSLLTQVLDRHHRVQQQKQKGDWIDCDGERLTLLSGGDQREEMPTFDDHSFLHPFRVVNAYSFLHDLGQVKFSEATGDEED